LDRRHCRQFHSARRFGRRERQTHRRRWGWNGVFNDGDDSVIAAVTGANCIYTVSGLPMGNTEGVGGVDEVIELAGGGSAIHTLRTVIGTN
jgi:hypothetical protein